jgi:hypothetical protein
MNKALDHWKVLPHETLEELDDGLLTAAGEIPMPLGHFPRRMTVARLRGGRTVVFSAIALDEPEMARIEAMGRPSFMIVPSAHHRLDARIWKERYPDIRVLAPQGAREAVSEVAPVDATEDVLDDPEVHFIAMPGTEARDAAMTVRREGGLTVVCNDMIGNVAHPHGLGAAIMGRLLGFGVKEPEVPRPIKAMISDREALARQFRAWAEDPELKRLVVSHGDVIGTDPRGVLTALAEKLAA